MSDAESGKQDNIKLLLEKVDGLVRVIEMYSRPFIAVDLYPREFVNSLYMRIRNIGHSPALNIEINFDKSFRFRDRDVNQYNIFRNIPVLGAGDMVAFFYGTGPELLNSNKESSILSGNVLYSDLSGNQYTNTIRFDLEIYRNLALVADDLYSREVTDELGKIRQSIDEISHYYRDQRMKELSDLLEKQKKQETEDEPSAGE